MARCLTPRESLLFGWLCGSLSYIGLLSWIIDTFRAANLSVGLAILCLVALAAYLGLFWGMWTWWLQRGHGPLAGAAAWVGLEYLRTYLFSGFPWTLWGDSQVTNLPLIQMASVTGVYGVSFLVVLGNLALASGRMRTIFYTMPIVIAAYAYGYWTLKAAKLPATSSVKVALLQGNIDQYKKWDDQYVRDIQNAYAALISQAMVHNPDLIVWPETSVPGYLLQNAPLRSWLENVVRASRTWHIVGSPVQHHEKSYNTSFSISPEGYLEDEYAKVHLVPFGEIVPFATILGRWVSVLNELGGFTAGTASPLLSVGKAKAGVSICYEAIFPNLVRQGVKEGAEILVNLTNDAWYMKTAAPYQHLAPNILRAVENRRWFLRANNTGISAIVDPFGRVVAASPLFEQAVVEGFVEPRSTQTPYTRFGDVFAWLCMAFCGLMGRTCYTSRADDKKT